MATSMNRSMKALNSTRELADWPGLSLFARRFLAATWENVPSHMCTQRKFKSICASAQSAQSLLPHKETFYPWLSKMRPAKILISLRDCADWSESSLGAHVRRYVLWRCSFIIRRTKCGNTMNGHQCIGTNVWALKRHCNRWRLLSKIILLFSIYYKASRRMKYHPLSFQNK